MSRILPLLAALALPASLLAADPDVVTVRQSGKEIEKRGLIEKETPDTITFRSGGASADFPAKDVVFLSHGDAPGEYRQAEEAEQGGDYRRASEFYQKAASVKGRPWLAHDSLYRRADCLYRLGSLKEAAAVLKELSEKAPEGRFRSLSQVRLGQCHLFLKAWADAETAFKALRNPRRNWEDAAGAYWLGRLAEAKGDLNAARRTYEEAGLVQFQDIKVMAQARKAACDVQEGKAVRELLEKDKPGNLLSLAEENSPEKAAGAAVQNAIGQAYLALARAAKDKPDEAAARAFEGAMAFCRVLVFSEAFAEEHAFAHEGAAQCFSILKDEAKATQCRNILKEFYGDAFPTAR